MSDPRRTLPSVDALVRDLTSDPVAARVAAWAARRAIDEIRARIDAGAGPEDPADTVRSLVGAHLDQLARPGRVINATGMIGHTNLGRAQLSDAAIAAIVDAAGATALELSLDTGARGGRGRSAELLVAALTDAEDALVVNNNAGALVLILAALAKRREVIVSRGELIEIGGGFRLPAVLDAAGALLVEVGTTNRTRIDDVAAAIGPRTSAVLRAHPSNFRIEGFTEAPARRDIVELCARAGLVSIEDLGSGLLHPDPALSDEPDASSALAAGVDLVCFSGDKLLGGPQAGIVAGRGDLIATCRAHPLMRALRADKLTLAALDATLRAHAAGDPAAIPAFAMRSTSIDELRTRAERIVGKVPSLRTVELASAIGGGAAPGVTLPSIGLALTGNPDTVTTELRAAEPPVIGRIVNGSCVLDLRTVDPRDDDVLIELLSLR
jgi:L-seryl-tRNA(Ser) seleniumtransferase